MPRKLHDLHVQPESLEEEALESHVQVAGEIGTDVIALTPVYKDSKHLERLKKNLPDDEYGLKVFPGAKIEVEDVKEMKDQLSAVRDRVPVVCVAGGDPEINRAAAGDPRVDFIAHPGLDRKDCGIDHVIAKKAAENQVALEVNFRLLLENSGKYRMYQLKKIEEYVMFNQKFGTPLITNSGARKTEQLRNPRDMSAVLQGLGLAKGEVLETVDQVPGEILERFRERNKEGFVRPGVTREVEG
ncbi:MAG: RNase P subunit p30 family protein [Candidatus Nanohaloarchaea archaeon]|nr:RNase P subunit p30 family protein [Candidatus Nanohaloarchaea archaeon]